MERIWELLTKVTDAKVSQNVMFSLKESRYLYKKKVPYIIIHSAVDYSGPTICQATLMLQFF